MIGSLRVTWRKVGSQSFFFFKYFLDGGQTGRPMPGMGMMPGSHAAMPGSQGGSAGPGGQDDWVPKSYLEKGRLSFF